MTKIGVEGILAITELPSDRMLFGDDYSRAVRAGDAKLVFREHNLVVDIGLSVPSRMLGGNAGAPTLDCHGFNSLDDLVITRMELGNKISPADPADADNAGVQALVYLPNIVITYPDAFTVQFSGLVPVSECNGLTLTEEALKLRNGKLFAKTTFSRVKSDSYALQFDHWFKFVRA